MACSAAAYIHDDGTMVLPPARKTVFEGLFDALSDEGDSGLVSRPSRVVRVALWAEAVPQGSSLDTAAPQIPSQYTASESLPAAAQSWPSDPAGIARMLGLREGMTTEDISLVRRAFAQRNHPDLIPEELRDLATARMQAVNAVLDGYAKSLTGARMSSSGPD